MVPSIMGRARAPPGGLVMSTVDTNNKLADPELFTDILAEIAIGSTLVKECEKHSIHFKAVNRWINDSDERARRYQLALDIREQHAKDLIIAELIAYLKADVTTCFDEVGNLLRMTEMGPNERRLIAGIEFREIFEWTGPKGEKEQVHTGNIIKVKFWDKPRSIETFMKHLAMLVDRKDLTSGGKSYAELIAESMKPKAVASSTAPHDPE